MQGVANSRTILVLFVSVPSNCALGLTLVLTRQDIIDQLLIFSSTPVPSFSGDKLRSIATQNNKKSTLSPWRAKVTPAAVPEVSAMAVCHLLPDTS